MINSLNQPDGMNIPEIFILIERAEPTSLNNVRVISSKRAVGLMMKYFRSSENSRGQRHVAEPGSLKECCVKKRNIFAVQRFPMFEILHNYIS